MKKTWPFLFLLIGCSSTEVTEKKSFTAVNVAEDEWATYEGRWHTKAGIYSIELSLNTGSYGYKSNYRISEHFEKKESAGGNLFNGLYSSDYHKVDDKVLITLHDLNKVSFISFLRYSKWSLGKDSEEMYFMTRGNEELIPCNDDFEPLTEDPRYTLHKRSKLFTVEGYITFEKDSAVFFERNTGEHWNVAHLGEFEELKKSYRQLAKVEHEGVYVRALAYSITNEQRIDTVNFLVIKRAKSIGNDPEDY